MDTNKEGLAKNVMLDLKAKKRECLGKVSQLIAYYYDRYNTLDEKLRGRMTWTVLSAVLGMALLVAFIGFATPGVVNYLGIAAVIVIGYSAYLATSYERMRTNAIKCESRIGELHELADLIRREPQTPDTAAWFHQRYVQQLRFLDHEFQNAVMQFGPAVVVAAAAPVGDAGKLMDTISDIGTTVAVADLSDDMVDAVAKGVHGAIESLH